MNELNCFFIIFFSLLSVNEQNEDVYFGRDIFRVDAQIRALTKVQIAQKISISKCV